MPDKIEPLSDPFKNLLKSININPEQFNAGITAKNLMKAVRGRNSTRYDNREFYEKVGRLDTIKDVAERCQKKPPRVYFPLGYVMYIRKAHCKNCQAEHVCMDAPGLFLMQTDKIGSPTRVFTPATGVDFPGLPHWTQETAVDVPFCLECYSIDPLPAGSAGEGATLSPSTPTGGSDQPIAPPAQEAEGCQP